MGWGLKFSLGLLKGCLDVNSSFLLQSASAVSAEGCRLNGDGNMLDKEAPPMKSTEGDCPGFSLEKLWILGISKVSSVFMAWPG